MKKAKSQIKANIPVPIIQEAESADESMSDLSEEITQNDKDLFDEAYKQLHEKLKLEINHIKKFRKYLKMKLLGNKRSRDELEVDEE